MRVFLLLLSSLLISTSLNAAEKGPSEDQRVGEGLVLMLKGENQKAWDLLFPEAKAGNVTAMYHLGMMMMRATNTPDHLQRAKTFFEAAAKRGHKGSEAMLLQVQKSLAAATPGTLPSIAGKSGLPVPADLEGAKRQAERMRQQVGRFIDPLREAAAEVTIMSFVSDNSDAVEKIRSAIDEVRARFGDRVDAQFFVLIDQATWDPKRVFNQQSGQLPMLGFTPDMGGRIASQYGVRSTPALVLIPKNGQPRVVNNPASLVADLTSFLN
ncbi:MULTISPECIES: sel1 repeat family protein [Pseudomonas aeruginosa group]|uniref:Sel1 repeat family protein n=1 Tax=Pseudomonas paraeruginosa TaxID=2994495 RepID=A0A2R3J5X8_9PSED|nr:MULTISPECIES: sel1 repeat family protein [Pseudomonas aeruginosa group]AVK09543.1 hypothetical protein CSB93_6643 [Pseudomonas paraeruginosa]AWE95558.1 hypothetical protein CSC28_6795 [Pseudomonas paraeruginosa]EKU2925372.1 sel1 repeat family protein [Pseudomonas aeruginosa]MCU9196806.1 sel1 repeat family protein [Pseudomonas aeruginosa]MCU9228824.1 sel1 repeat family protein [Pseudomonas aeruginosa]